jgi:heme/copper-type cytochrome/quinol oxidase subunit 2
MDPVNAIVMLLHPLLASALLVWVWWQYSWRKKSHELKGEERKDARSRHERMGERLLWATFGVILVAFMARAVVGLRTNGDALSNLMPQSLHGFMGPVGFALLFLLARMGRKAKRARNNGEKFSHHVLKHGRAADLVVVLVFIHAFLGFLYLFMVLG